MIKKTVFFFKLSISCEQKTNLTVCASFVACLMKKILFRTKNLGVKKDQI